MNYCFVAAGVLSVFAAACAVLLVLNPASEAERARNPYVRQIDDDINCLVRSVGLERYPAWNGPKTSDVIANLHWSFNPVIYGNGRGWSFDSTLIYPFPGAKFADRYAFRFLLPRGEQRGVLYRASGHEHADEKKRDYIMWECAQRATEEYRAPVQAILATERAAEQARMHAEAELARFATTFKASVEADAIAVIAALKAGGPAKLRDWLNDLKPPEALYHQLKGVVSTAQSDVEQARREAQWKREEAVGEAERQVAAAKEEARLKLLSGPIPFAGVVPGALILGSVVRTGDLFDLELKHLQHTLITGASGSGKSVLLHLMCYQMLELPEFEEVNFVDLKEGIEFDRYRGNSKARVVWEFDDVVSIVDRLAELASKRAEIMRANRWQLWRGGRIALVIDEFTELQTAIDAAAERDERAKAKRLMANVLSLARRARAYGIILIIAVQKATDDGLPSALRNNLGCRLVLRCGSSVMARSLLDIGDDYLRLSERPTELPDGRFYYYNTSTGALRRVQAHIAPGVELS